MHRLAPVVELIEHKKRPRQIEELKQSPCVISLKLGEGSPRTQGAATDVCCSAASKWSSASLCQLLHKPPMHVEARSASVNVLSSVMVDDFGEIATSRDVVAKTKEIAQACCGCRRPRRRSPRGTPASRGRRRR